MSNENHGSWKSAILNQLDQSAREFEFPVLNNIDLQHANVRLTAFRSVSEWLIVFEEVALFRERTFMNTISAYGNKVQKPGVQLALDKFIEPVTNHPIWDSEGNFLLDTGNFEIILNGRVQLFTPTPEDYKRAGVDMHIVMPEPIRVLRLLSFLLPDEFFLGSERLLSRCGRDGQLLAQFLQLDGWHHPDVADGELPSESVCFRNLASALSQNDSALYSCPDEMINTHWSNWDLE